MIELTKATAFAKQGRALVVVRSTRKGGDINLTVSTPGMADAAVTIKAE